MRQSLRSNTPMARAWVVIGIVLLASCSPTAGPQTDREMAGLIGPARSVVTKDSPLVTTELYDPTGKLTERLVDVLDPYPLQTGPLKEIYEYNDQGLRTGIKEMNARDGSTVTTTQYIYDLDGNLSAIVTTNASRSMSSTFYTYDIKKKVIGEVRQLNSQMILVSLLQDGKRVGTLLYENGALQSQTRDSYDLTGHMIESRYFVGDGTLKQKTVYKYDDKGNQIEKAVFDNKDLLLSSISSSYLYDSRGNWISRKSKEKLSLAERDSKALGKPAETLIERTITYYQ